MTDRLLPLPLTERSVHLCVDMQRIFSPEGPWPTPRMEKVLPVAGALVSRHPERTVFTRFIPPARPDRMPGTWQRYYTRWRAATREQLDLRFVLSMMVAGGQRDESGGISSSAHKHMVSLVRGTAYRIAGDDDAIAEVNRVENGRKDADVGFRSRGADRDSRCRDDLVAVAMS